VLGDDVFPLFLPFGFAVGEDNRAGFVFDRFEQDEDFVADFRRYDLVETFVFPLLEVNDAFALVADIDDDIVTDDIEHATFDDFVGVEDIFFGKGHDGMSGVIAFQAHRFRELLFEVFLGEVELTHQIPIYHAREILPTIGTNRPSH